jgi:hypothetical protein
MDRIIYLAALLVNIIQIGFSVFLYWKGYGREAALALLFILPPVVSIAAIHFSPDHEERRLTRKLRKARLRRELEEMEKA